MALTTLPETFPIGLRVLALDVDTTHHPILHAMGNRFQYQVMSSHYSTNSVMEAITKGASDYLNAKPKQILKIMDVPGLTREHVASHLQKFKHKLEKGVQKRGRKKISVLSSSVESVETPIHTLHEQKQIHSNQISNRQQEEFCDTSDIFDDLPEDLSSLFFQPCPPTEVEFCDYDASDIFDDLPEDLSSLFCQPCPPTPTEVEFYENEKSDIFYDLPEDLSSLFFEPRPPTEVDDIFSL